MAPAELTELANTDPSVLVVNDDDVARALVETDLARSFRQPTKPTVLAAVSSGSQHSYAQQTPSSDRSHRVGQGFESP